MIPLVAINQLAGVYRGRGRNEAYLEFAQEHFLDWLSVEGLFEDEAVVFKGGTAIRKFVLGNEGRFSTDLDFAVADETYADFILTSLADGVSHQGVEFSLDELDAEARKGTWHAETPEHGRSLQARLDFSPRSMLLPPVYPDRAPIRGVSAQLMGFDLPMPPVADILETVAEKLSRFRRVMLGRDVYDLATVTAHVEGRIPLLLETLCFKSFFDRVEERRDTLPVPFRGGVEFAGRDAGDVVGAEDLGLLARDRVDIPEMLRTIEAHYTRLGTPSGELELRLAACRFEDLYWARTEYQHRAAELRLARPA